MIIVNSIQPLADLKTVKRKYKYHINITQALSGLKNTIVLLMINPYETTCQIISDLQDLFLKCLESVRPGRSYKRNFKKRNKKFHSAYRQPA